jgi:hypothetical protein
MLSPDFSFRSGGLAASTASSASATASASLSFLISLFSASFFIPQRREGRSGAGGGGGSDLKTELTVFESFGPNFLLSVVISWTDAVFNVSYWLHPATLSNRKSSRPKLAIE